ncbi:MAG: NYN domain-containing protein [Candidatus Omnitrophota bacterium]
MPNEPDQKRAVAFFDGQNLFLSVKYAFGYTHPNYNPLALAESIANSQSWSLSQVNFYTGMPSYSENPFWNNFWIAKLAVMESRGIHTYSRLLKYTDESATLPDGTSASIRIGREKGIDVRIALDIVRMAQENLYDVALIFSQDQDLSEAIDEVRNISRYQSRWIKVACAFPFSPFSGNKCGLERTDWIRIEKETYDACIDPIDYRPKTKT